MSSFAKKVLPVVVALGIGIGLDFVLDECPPCPPCPKDYWPNNYPNDGDDGYYVKLGTIVNRAVQAILHPPAGQSPDADAQACIDLALKCASQDLSSQDPSYHAVHAAAVDRAHDAATAAQPDWVKCRSELTSAPAASGVNHPH